MPSKTTNFDALVVGGGIAGLQAALDLADQDFKVAIVEKDSSIGGKMIRLSKVFPTLDCSSCITTPKMAAAAHHENITIFTYCDLQSLQRNGDTIAAAIRQKPRYVDEPKCIGCRQCEYECPVYVSDPDQGGFSARKAICVPFSNAIPQIAVREVENCILCGKCEKVCPTQAVNYFQEPEDFMIKVRTTILATGFGTTPVQDKHQYGEGKIPNVITALQMERLLAPHGPYNRVLRPSDGMEPDSIAYIQCAGSRALPLADIAIYYMDIRAFGKGYEEFFQNAMAMGIEFVRGKVATLSEGENGGVVVHYESQEDGGGVTQTQHDLVVLSLGIVPDWKPDGYCQVSTGSDGFIKTIKPKIAPSLTEMEGVFVAGAAAGPKDIVDSIAEAGAAAMEAAKYLTATNSPHKAVA
jgi:heterodisulfide reductase subunit A